MIRLVKSRVPDYAFEFGFHAAQHGRASERLESHAKFGPSKIRRYALRAVEHFA